MKELTINLNANEAQGEAYWRKRCDAVEAELTRLRAEVKRLKEAISPAYVETLPDGTALIMTKAVKTEILRLRAENERMREALKRIASIYDSMKPVCECAGDAYDMHCVAAQALGPSSEQNPETCVWKYEEAWVSGCGLQYINAVIDADMKFCPFCGKRVEVKE